MARITAIESQKRTPDRVNVHLDGEFAFGLPVALGATLRIGEDLDAQQVHALKRAEAEQAALAQAVHFLSFRPRSERELRTFLRGKRLQSDVLEQTISHLRKNHFLDDAQFARSWVENREAFRPRSRRALASELRKKGIPAAAIEAATEDLSDNALAYAAGRKRAAHLAPLQWREFRTRLYAFLARRGFSTDSIQPAVLRLWAEHHDGQIPMNNNEDNP
jgi:regulatory protein